MDTSRETAAAAMQIKAPGEAIAGDQTICPVMEHTITVRSTTPKVEYQGKAYYLCCRGCVEAFAADPESFLASFKRP